MIILLFSRAVYAEHKVVAISHDRKDAVGIHLAEKCILMIDFCEKMMALLDG
jgi:hypothetical protein